MFLSLVLIVGFFLGIMRCFWLFWLIVFCWVGLLEWVGVVCFVCWWGLGCGFLVCFGWWVLGCWSCWVGWILLLGLDGFWLGCWLDFCCDLWFWFGDWFCWCVFFFLFCFSWLGWWCCFVLFVLGCRCGFWLFCLGRIGVGFCFCMWCLCCSVYRLDWLCLCRVGRWVFCLDCLVVLFIIGRFVVVILVFWSFCLLGWWMWCCRIVLLGFWWWCVFWDFGWWWCWFFICCCLGMFGVRCGLGVLWVSWEGLGCVYWVCFLCWVLVLGLIVCFCWLRFLCWLFCCCFVVWIFWLCFWLVGFFCWSLLLWFFFFVYLIVKDLIWIDLILNLVIVLVRIFGLLVKFFRLILVCLLGVLFLGYSVGLIGYFMMIVMCMNFWFIVFFWSLVCRCRLLRGCCLVSILWVWLFVVLVGCWVYSLGLEWW